MENNVPPIASPPPPPVIIQSRPTPPRRRRGWMILALILAALLGLSLWQNATHFMGRPSGKTGRQSGRTFEEVSVENNGSENKILILDVQGIISSDPWDRSGHSMVDLISDQFHQAERDDTIRGVILKVDSPGGEVMASDDIARSIAEFQGKAKKPVIAAMGGMAASGGYYIAAPCQWIVANELTITGSIGVILQTFNYRGLMDKVGLYPQVFKSGKFKDMLRGSKTPDEILPEAMKMIQGIVDETYGKFKQVVADGRARAEKLNRGQGKLLVHNWRDFADGRILTGRQALDLGFVDELGSFDAAVQRAKKLAHVADANLIRYEEPFSLSKIFSLFGRAESAKLKIDLGLDLPKLKAGRPYFLSESLVN